MTFTKKTKHLFSFLCLFTVSFTFSQTLLGPIQLEIPAFATDKEGKVEPFDYSIKLNAFTDKKLSLESFKNENLLVFYFSAKCGHCKAAYPHLKKLFAEIKSKGIKMVAISAAMNKEKDIAHFVTSLKVDVPVFHDKNRGFSKKYGSGKVPLIMLVNKHGNHFKLKKFDKVATIDQISFALNDKAKF